MAVVGSQEIITNDGQGNQQQQRTVQHATPLSVESPSSVYKLVQNDELLKNLERRFSGYSLSTDINTGKLTWQPTGAPPLSSLSFSSIKR